MASPIQRTRKDSVVHLTGVGGYDVAVDLGTTNAVIYVRGRGIRLCEPSLVAVDPHRGTVSAVGADARTDARTRGSRAKIVHPVGGGVITDFERTKELLTWLIQKACPSHRHRPRLVVMSMPGVATSVEKRAIEEVCLSAGARHASVIGAAMAAAIGAGLPIGEPAGSMVVDVGGGTCEAAVIALGEIVVSRSIRGGGDEFDEAIIKLVRREYGLLIDAPTAEELRVAIGSTHPIGDVLEAELSGRQLRSGLPKAVTVSSPAIRAALERPVGRIVETVTETLRETPPELGADIIDRGLMLTGGGSRLRGLAERLRQETQLPVHLAELPITCVAAGSGVWLEELATDRRFDQEIVEWAA